MIEWASITFSVILSIIAITISIRQYVLFKKAQILRPHSDRIGKVFKSWLESDTFLPEVVDTANMPEDSIAISVHSAAKLTSIPYALQHLETGYPKISLRLKDLEKQIKEHNELTHKFFVSLQDEVKKELGLAESAKERRYAYYRRIVSYSLRRIVTGYPEANPEVKQRSDQRWELRWSNAGLVIGNREDCEKGLRFIEKLLSSKNAEKSKSLSGKAKTLEIRRRELREVLHLKIVDNLELGGIIRGKCDVCR